MRKRTGQLVRNSGTLTIACRWNFRRPAFLSLVFLDLSFGSLK